MKNFKTPTVIGLAVAASLITGGVFATQSGAEFDLPGLNQKVQRHDEQLENHEARITNTENDVTDLQNSTNTPPSSNRQDVPAVTTPNPPPTTTQTTEPTPAPPAPAAVTVVAYEQVPVPGSEDVDCKITYSDNTTHVFRWKTVTYNQGATITNTSGKCDQSAVGKTKSTAVYSGYN